MKKHSQDMIGTTWGGGFARRFDFKRSCDIVSSPQQALLYLAQTVDHGRSCDLAVARLWSEQKAVREFAGIIYSCMFVDFLVFLSLSCMFPSSGTM